MSDVAVVSADRPAPTIDASVPGAGSTGAPWRRVNGRVALALGVLFVVVIPLSILQGSWGAFSVLQVVQTFLMAFAGTMLALTLAQRRPPIMQLIVYLFTYTWMGLAPLVQYSVGRSPLPAVFPDSVAFSATLLTLVGLVAYVIGTHLPSLRPRENGTLARFYRRELVPWRVAAVVVIALLLFVVVVPRLGGVATLFSSRQQATEARITAISGAGAGASSTQVLLSWLLSVSAFWALLGLILVGRARAARTPWWWLGLVLMIAENVAVNNPISRPRYWAGTVLVGLLLTLPLMRRPRVRRGAVVVLVLAVLFVFPYADYFRYRNTADQKVSVAGSFTRNDYDAYAMLEAGLDFTKEHGHQPQYLLTNVLFFVPRYLWEGKTTYVGEAVAEDNNFTLTNRSSPLWLESYLWGGAGATLGVFLLLGIAHRRLDDADGDESQTVSRLAIGPAFVAVMGIFGLFYLRGSLLPAMAPFAFLIVAPLLLSSRRGSSDRSAAGTRSEIPQARSHGSLVRVVTK